MLTKAYIRYQVDGKSRYGPIDQLGRSPALHGLGGEMPEPKPAGGHGFKPKASAYTVSLAKLAETVPNGLPFEPVRDELVRRDAGDSLEIPLGPFFFLLSFSQ
jgi:hypothetical protein